MIACQCLECDTWMACDTAPTCPGPGKAPPLRIVVSQASDAVDDRWQAVLSEYHMMAGLARASASARVGPDRQEETAELIVDKLGMIAVEVLTRHPTSVRMLVEKIHILISEFGDRDGILGHLFRDALRLARKVEQDC